MGVEANYWKKIQAISADRAQQARRAQEEQRKKQQAEFSASEKSLKQAAVLIGSSHRICNTNPTRHRSK